MGLPLGIVAGAALWCVILLVATGWAGFGWLAGVLALITLAALFVNRPGRGEAVRGRVRGAGGRCRRRAASLRGR